MLGLRSRLEEHIQKSQRILIVGHRRRMKDYERERGEVFIVVVVVVGWLVFEPSTGNRTRRKTLETL